MKALEQIRTDMVAGLSAIGDESHSLNEVREVLNIIDKALSESESYVSDNGFENIDQEIAFYKVWKPEIIALRVREVLSYAIERNEPIGPPEVRMKYLMQHSEALDRFFRMNAFYYQYYKHGLKELDSYYFTSSAVELPIPVVEESDNTHPYHMWLLFGKFIGYEAVQHRIMLKITQHHGHSIEDGPNSKKKNTLKWTGDMTNLVELAYGLWLTGQINHGNASLNEIVRWLESELHVSFGIIQRRFAEVTARKRISVTKYIDHMKESILRKIEDDQSA